MTTYNEAIGGAREIGPVSRFLEEIVYTDQGTEIVRACREVVA